MLNTLNTTRGLKKNQDRKCVISSDHQKYYIQFILYHKGQKTHSTLFTHSVKTSLTFFSQDFIYKNQTVKFIIPRLCDKVPNSIFTKQGRPRGTPGRSDRMVGNELIW